MDRASPASAGDRGIYFSELNCQGLPGSSPSAEREGDGGVYDLAGSSGVFKVKGKRVSGQLNQDTKGKHKDDWTTATKLQTTLVFIAVILSITALTITMTTQFDGKIHFEIKQELKIASRILQDMY